MIKLLGLGFAVALSASVSAVEDGGDISQLEYCKVIEKYAGEIMLARQDGASYSGLYESFAKIEDSGAKKMMLALLKVAYEDYSQYQTDKYQQRAVDKFKNVVFMSCMNKEV